MDFGRYGFECFNRWSFPVKYGAVRRVIPFIEVSLSLFRSFEFFEWVFKIGLFNFELAIYKKAKRKEVKQNASTNRK